MSEKNITFEIKEHLGVITEFDSGWNKELNIISWNGNAPKYDIRDWDAHHERMRKGITLRETEFRRLVDLYLHNNSQKAVEQGRALEAGRKQRQRAQNEQYWKNSAASEKVTSDTMVSASSVSSASTVSSVSTVSSAAAEQDIAAAASAVNTSVAAADTEDDEGGGLEDYSMSGEPGENAPAAHSSGDAPIFCEDEKEQADLMAESFEREKKAGADSAVFASAAVPF